MYTRDVFIFSFEKINIGFNVQHVVKGQLFIILYYFLRIYIGSLFSPRVTKNSKKTKKIEDETPVFFKIPEKKINIVYIKNRI